MRILVLEAYDGGSHGQFLDGLIAHSRHDYVRIGMPPRKWKWRMRGAALFFAQEIVRQQDGWADSIDLIFTSDMTPVADLRALLPKSLAALPIICYFHENQLTYPVPDESDRDYQYGFTNITSCLAADSVWFNSQYHRDSFVNAVRTLLGKMPDCVPEGVDRSILERSKVMPLGLDPGVFELSDDRRPEQGSRPTTFLWNHRWEYDKDPDTFFEAFYDLDRAGVDFRLLVAGETFRTAPPIFAVARKQLAHRVDHWGYCESREEYWRLLSRADVAVSTSIHEFFGLAVMEAVAASCYPVLPYRLSYPELLPESCHAGHFYHNESGLRICLTQLCTQGVPPLKAELRRRVGELSWANLARRYDNAFEAVVGG